MSRVKFRVLAATLVSFLAVFSLRSVAQDWEADWWTVDGGGEILMEDASGSSNWQLSGTIGQWDATNAEGSVSGKWELTGGFWSVSISGTDFLFSDGFEDPDSSG